MAALNARARATSAACLFATYVACLFAACAGVLHAQRAPVFIEPGHWAWDAVRRFNVQGAAPASSDPALAPVTLQHVLAVFDTAGSRGENSGRDDVARLARSYAALLADELPSHAQLLSFVELSAGWMAARGEALAGDGYFLDEDREGAQPLASASGPAAAVRAHGFVQPWLAWQVRGGRLGDEWVIPTALLTANAGPFDVWAGRQRLHYGVGRAGGTVQGTGWGAVTNLAHRTSDTFDGVGVHVREPFHFPSFLRILGPDRIEMVAGRIDSNGHVAGPYVVFGRLIGTPFTRRFTLGINRGAIFGGEGNPITVDRLLGLLIGLHGGEHGEFENQVFSVMGRLRPPLGPVALELYAEFGMDDTAGAISDMPGLVAGADLGAVPGLPAVSLGVEHTQFPQLCCGNTIWYRSVFFRGPWADEGRLFAHPLGGQGREWLTHARIDLPERGLLLRTEAYTRRRGGENVFSPGMHGSSRGVRVRADYHATETLRIHLDAELERASGWRRHQLSLTAAHVFGHRADR